MMKNIILYIVILLFNNCLLFSQVAINPDGSPPDASAGLDVNYPNKGFLPPRMTRAELNSISNPAEGLIAFCTDCGVNGTGAMAIFMGGAWRSIVYNDCLDILPAAVEGTHISTASQIEWKWLAVTGALGYRWGTTNNFAIAEEMGNVLSKIQTGLNCNTGYTAYVWAYNACGESTESILSKSTLPVQFQTPPAAATHVATSSSIEWNWNPVEGAEGYKWNTTNEINTAIEMGTETTRLETGLDCNNSFTRYVWSYDNCGASAPTSLTMSTTFGEPPAPVAGTHVATTVQITWNWNSVSGATGYKFGVTDDYNTATDMQGGVSYTETGLICDSSYTRYIWAYNSCGNSTSLTLTGSTLICSVCGNTFIINHVAGNVAPVTKTVSYSTVTNVPGLPEKCWITSNLGADHQATSKSDATEASAGWYWQFNRMQGYKHDGTTRSPNTTWITEINEYYVWTLANDPCNIELGDGWRIPTNTEWEAVDAGPPAWTNYNGPWNSVLKLHLAGRLNNNDATVEDRGTKGYYWSSSQTGSTTTAFCIYFNPSICGASSYLKAFAMPLRCLKD